MSASLMITFSLLTWVRRTLRVGVRLRLRLRVRVRVRVRVSVRARVKVRVSGLELPHTSPLDLP